MIQHDGVALFENLPDELQVGRYHSLCAETDSLPTALKVTATTEQGEIMGVRHTELAVEGVQFHPESVLTPEGDRLMQNFLDMSS